jgi:hypothetical protein
LKDDRIRQKAFNRLVSEHCELGHDMTPCFRRKLVSSTVPSNIVDVTIW